MKFVSFSNRDEDVYRRVGMSKKVFKKALGALFRQGLVRLEPEATILK